jgi:hypothetical protein
MAQQPIEVFFSYSREDKPLRDKLEIHLSSLKRQGVISAWHDRQIVAGSEWEEEIDRHMRTADIILLLISPDFVASKYCYDTEFPVAMDRHDAGEAYVVPILLRPVAGWKRLPFAKLQVYPSGGIPITEWTNQDRAFVDAAEGIQESVDQLLEKREQERLRVEATRQQQTEEATRAKQAKLSEQARTRDAEQRAKEQRHKRPRLEESRSSQKFIAESIIAEPIKTASISGVKRKGEKKVEVKRKRRISENERGRGIKRTRGVGVWGDVKVRRTFSMTAEINDLLNIEAEKTGESLSGLVERVLRLHWEMPQLYEPSEKGVIEEESLAPLSASSHSSDRRP